MIILYIYIGNNRLLPIMVSVMEKIKDIWKSNSMLQVFLSVASGKKTEHDISEDTGFKQPVVNQYLKQMSSAKLIKRYKIPKTGKRYTVIYDYNLDPIVKLGITANTQIGFIKEGVIEEIIETLRKHFKDVIKEISVSPTWRNDYFNKKYVSKIKDDMVSSCMLSGKKHIIIGTNKLVFYQKQKRKYTFMDLAMSFVPHIYINNNKLNKKEKDIFDLYLQFFMISFF